MIMITPQSRLQQNSELSRTRMSGRHSNIPECCIDFYEGPWEQLWRTDEGQRMDPRWEINYVRCPGCIEKDYVIEVHLCDATCRY